MRTLVRFALAASLLVATGCAQLRIGTSFRSSAADEIQVNMTSRAEVRGLMGAPLRSHTVGDVTVDVHKFVRSNTHGCVYVSYRGDTVMHVTRLR